MSFDEKHDSCHNRIKKYLSKKFTSLNTNRIPVITYLYVRPDEIKESSRTFYELSRAWDANVIKWEKKLHPMILTSLSV